MNLNGKVAIITGGGTGIGFGIAEVLAEKGVSLVLGQPHLETAELAADRLKRTEVLPFEIDIRDPQRATELVEATVRRFGKVDILVNNASITGTPAIVPMLECEPATVDEIVDVNLKGTFYCSQRVARHMVLRGGGGSIVNITSVGAYAAQEFASLYCATKAAQAALAQAMALELAHHNIRVNCVAPGDIKTEASIHVIEDKRRIGGSGRYMRVTPLGRRGSPSDIGYAVAYLVSDEGAFITGTTLKVDGGFLSY